jgi:hypothetical protein
MDFLFECRPVWHVFAVVVLAYVLGLTFERRLTLLRVLLDRFDEWRRTRVAPK